jgi:hypothetical protein
VSADSQVVDRFLREQRIREWLRSCLSKRRYPSEQKAWIARSRYARAYRSLQRPYYCEQCGGWHLSSRPPKGSELR